MNMKYAFRYLTPYSLVDGTNEFQVLTVMTMKNAFRYLTTCSLLDRYQVTEQNLCSDNGGPLYGKYQHFRRTILHLKQESSSKTLLSIYSTRGTHISSHSNIRNDQIQITVRDGIQELCCGRVRGAGAKGGGGGAGVSQTVCRSTLVYRRLECEQPQINTSVR